MSATAQSLTKQLSNPFIYSIKAPNSIWEKIVIHGSAMTLYYRILRGKEGQEQDEALFSVAPDCYEYIFDQQEEHEGLHAHSFKDSLFLHRHLKLKTPISVEKLQEVINVFRKLEPICAQYGKYKNGKYIFISKEEETLLLQQYSKHLGLSEDVTADDKLQTDISRLSLQLSTTSNGATSDNLVSSKNFVPQYKIMPHPKPSKEEGIRQHYAQKFGEAFMKKHGSAMKIENIGVDQYIVSITLPLSADGKQWFLKKEPDCQFESVTGGIKVTIKANVLSSDSIQMMIGQMQGMSLPHGAKALKQK